MNSLKDIFPPVFIKDTNDLKIIACVTDVYMGIFGNEIKVEVSLNTITSINPQGLKSSETLSISNENKIPVYQTTQTPKYDINGNQVYISEMQMWLNLMDKYTLKQCMQMIQESMKRKFGLITSDFVYIED
ncbi:hypothetical protein ACE193_21490 [Bernardetia sp. OM2101]|uniref:hypothetical protein n=1 Tax=Bernardetia sp. OM2101 TaxID=3344876 RepID=UPI0035CFAA04